MYFRAIAGMVAGLCAGVVSGIALLLMTFPDADGSKLPLLSLIAQTVGSMDAAVGWSYHLFNSAIVGAIFGVFLGKRLTRMLFASALGLMVGVVWWICGVLFMLPVIQGQGILAVAGPAMLRQLAIGTLSISCLQGILLSIVFFWLYRTISLEEEQANSQFYTQGKTDEDWTPVGTNAGKRPSPPAYPKR